MSLEAILNAILASGEAEVREIDQQAHSHAEEILAQAHAEAEHLRQETRAKVISHSSKESARIMQQARQEALQIVGNVREALVDEVLQQTRADLAAVRADPIYPKVMHFLIEETFQTLKTSLRPSEQPRFTADPRDRELVERMMRQLGLALPVSYDLDCQGGLIARSEDGRVVVTNTLESRLERATPYLRRYVAALFEETEAESLLPAAQT